MFFHKFGTRVAKILKFPKLDFIIYAPWSLKLVGSLSKHTSELGNSLKWLDFYDRREKL